MSRIHGHAAGGAFVALALALSGAGCGSRSRPAEETFTSMGTYASVMVPAEEKGILPRDAALAKRTLDEAEASMSLYRPDSELNRLNRSAGLGPQRVSEHLYQVLAQAGFFSAASGGAFDVTVTPLLRLWGFSGGRVPDALPSDDELERAADLTGFRHLVLSDGTVSLERRGMQIDLGGIAKGFGVDLCAAALKAQGSSNVLVNLGGNMLALGCASGNRPWTIGVRNPFARNGMLGAVALESGRAVASSGNYERFVVIGGRRYAHIMDPRTRRPVEGMAGVTVLAPTATTADALSTTLFVLGPEQSARLLAQMPGCEALFVPDRQPVTIRVTPGFAKTFTPASEFAGCVSVLKPAP